MKVTNEKLRKTSDALEITRRMVGDEAELRVAIEAETVHLRVASLLFEARTAADPTQQQLAALIDSKQSVIARLENADDAGHSLSMLIRIADALGNRLVIDMVPRDLSPRTA